VCRETSNRARATEPTGPGGQGGHQVDTSGDSAVLARLMSLIDIPDPDFAIVTP